MVRAERATASFTSAPSEAGDDEQRFASIHHLYCDGLWRYVRRLGLTAAEADDATQQAFIVIAQRLATIRPGSERSFAYEVASRVASEFRRRASRRYEVSAEPDETVEGGSMPDDLLEERRRLSLLDRILEAMTPDLGQVFVLFEIEELSMREIATVLDIPQGTVASRIRRARDEFQSKAERFRKGDAP